MKTGDKITFEVVKAEDLKVDDKILISDSGYNKILQIENHPDEPNWFKFWLDGYWSIKRHKNDLMLLLSEHKPL